LNWELGKSPTSVITLHCLNKTENYFIHKRLFFAILDFQSSFAMFLNTKYVPQHGTKRLLDLCATGGHKMCHGIAQKVPQHGTKCATAQHKNTFRL
jgi:hypothetical protein